MVSQKDKEYLLSLKPEDLTFRTLVDLLGNTVDTKTKIEDRKLARFKTNEKLELLPSEYFVKEKTQTTVGRLIYNKYIVERLNLQDVLGYVNFPLTDSANAKKIEATLAKALVDDRITIDTFVKYVDYRDNLGMQLNSVITTSFTPNTIMTPKPIQKKRDELFKKYDKELSEGDIVVAERIEKELVAETKKLLQGDVGLDLYNSEARGNFNNFKNMNIFKGATMNNITGKYEIVRSAFMDGIKKEEIPNFASSITSGAYP